MIIGVDEVGRGCLAGPVCVAAVAWPKGAPSKTLADSKMLTAAKRVAAAKLIRAHAGGIGIGWASAEVIDRIGLNPALALAAQQAVKQIMCDADTVIVDGRDKLLGDMPAEYIIKADGKIHAVMAASIIAKVARDTYMQALHPLYPNYGFLQHVGYATKMHRAAIAEHGACQIHRMSFSPLKVMAS